MKASSNLAASIAASLWAAVVGLAVVPFYIKHLGIEAFGLIGFFGTLQALFYILDLGLASTMNREMARFSAMGSSGGAARLLDTLSWLYWFVALAMGLAIFLGAPLISAGWLNVATLSADEVSSSLMLMGLVIALRWPTGLYQGVLQGSERIVLASAISTLAVTLSYVGALIVIMFVSPTLEAFFIWQAVVALLHVAIISIAAWHSLRTAPRLVFDLGELKRVWRFSAGLGITALLAVVLMQLDKVILSKIVSLEAFGYYALAGLAPRTLYLLLTPVFTVVYPKFSRLHSLGEEASIVKLYRHGTRALVAIIFPLAAFVAMYGVEIFTLWTGDPLAASIAAPVAALLLVGTAANGAMHFPYALQLAYGESSLPARINFILVAAFIPLVSLLATRFGIIGGGAAWAIINLSYLCFGAIVTHRRILNGLAGSWLLEDVGMPAVATVTIVGVIAAAVHYATLPLLATMLAGIGSAALATLTIAMLSPGLMHAIQGEMRRSKDNAATN